MLVRLVLGRPGSVPGTSPVCPWDEPSLSLGHPGFSPYYTVEAQFVPGTNPVCSRDNPGVAQKVYVLKVYVPFSLATLRTPSPRPANLDLIRIGSKSGQNRVQVHARMNGGAFSINAPRGCSEKFAATLRRKFHTRGNVLRSGITPANQTQEKPVHELFPGCIPEQKFDVNRACFPKEKHQNSQKWGEIHELFVLALFWLVCRVTPDLDILFVLRRCWGASIEKVSTLKLI